MLPSPGSKEGPIDDSIHPFNQRAKSCASPDDPSSRCACADCPDVCLELPSISTPAEDRKLHCHVGSLSCFNFALILIYGMIVVMFFSGVGLKSLCRQNDISLSNLVNRVPRLRQKPSNVSSSGYDRMQMEDGIDEQIEDQQQQQADSLRSSVSTRSHRNPASSSGGTSGPDGASLAQRRLGQGAPPLLESYPLGTYQPRTYALNTILSRTFYSIGHFCAYKPYLTIALGLAICGIANSGWSKFAIEKDPVKLWVAKGSESERNKASFEQNFGPFYRTEQIFVAAAPSRQPDRYATEGQPRWDPVDQPVLTWERLRWWSQVEKDIQTLVSPKGTSLKDVCFAPAGPAESTSDCVIESPLGWLGDLSNVDEANWKDRLDECASSPSLCLTPSGMPLNPRLVLGGVPGFSGRHDEDTPFDDGPVKAHEARGITITYVVANSLNETVVQRAEEWEETLRRYLVDLSKRAPREAGVQIAYSTEISLEQELNKSTNTDVPIVVFSYVLMFLYVSFSLGGSLSGLGRIFRLALVKLWRTFRSKITGQGAVRLEDESQPKASVRKLIHRILLESKFVLGLWGIMSW